MHTISIGWSCKCYCLYGPYFKAQYQWMLQCIRLLHLCWHSQKFVITVSMLRNCCLSTMTLPSVLPLTNGKVKKAARFHWSKHSSQHSELDTSGVTSRQLLDGGHHFDDKGMNGRFNQQPHYNSISETTAIPLPRDRLHSFVIDIGVAKKTSPCKNRTRHTF